jgi:hypothetical protein
VLVLGNYFISTGGKMVWSFSQVYAFRDSYGDASQAGIFGYLNSWAAKIFSVILLAWSLQKKKLLITLFVMLLIILLFALSGHKGVLKGVLLVFFFYFLCKYSNTRLVLAGAFMLFLLSIVIITHVFDSTMLGSLLLRRLLFVPALLNFKYLEFFSNNEFVYWSNSILKSFVDYPYHIRPVEVVGEYLGNEGMAANTGFLANGYMHAGYLGVALYTAIAIVIFNIINGFSQKIESYFILSIAFIPINVLFVSADLFAAVLTHGLFW